MNYYNNFKEVMAKHNNDDLFKSLTGYKSLILSNHKKLTKKAGQYDRPIDRKALKITVIELVKHFEVIEGVFLERNTPVAQLYQLFNDYDFIKIKNKYKSK